MENASEALKMAGAVLLFVIALSVAIISFGQVRQTADVILSYEDRETTYIDGNLYYQEDSNRTVGLETVIPTLYQACFENFDIYFEGIGDFYTIKKGASANNKESRNGFLFSKDTLTIDEITGILYGKNLSDRLQLIVTGQSLYNKLLNKKIVEYSGIYYEQSDDSGVTEAMKDKKRLIIYKVI